MAITSIADLLALPWTHAYCTEGPEFQALIPTVTRKFTAGAAMFPPAAPSSYVSTWPDEIATENLTAGGGGTPSGGVFDPFANSPIYNPASSTFNGKPAVECTQNPLSATSAGVRFMSIAAASYPDIAQPFEWVIVAKPRPGSTGSILGETTAGGGFADICRFGYGTLGTWRLSFQGSALQGGTADTNLHLFRVVAGGTDQLYIDETLVLSGNAGPNSQKGLQIGRDAAASAGEKDYVFIGIKSGSLTAGQRSDIRAFCQSHYGTP